MFSKAGTRLTKYRIKDNFLRFWFRFVYPYQDLIESNRSEMLKQNILDNFSEFSGLCLEQFFRDKFMSSGKFTSVGSWWDKSSENEIDLIAVNDFTGKGIIAEIKRNSKKINLDILRQKAARLPKEFSKYDFEFLGLSVEDMTKSIE